MSGCPSTSLEVKTSSEKLKCAQPEVYHCLRNQVGEKTEQCIKPSWIQRGLCAEYNTIAERLDAKGCQPSRGLCPDKAYLSNDVISFSGCAPNEVVVTTINTTSSNDIHFESHDEGLSTITIAITCIIVFCIIALGVVVLIFFHRKRRAGNTNQDDENKDPLIERDNPSKKDDEEEQKIKHLEKEEEHLKFFECKGECPKHMLETIKKHLQNQTNVLIIGKPGSGKTTLAWTLCKQMHGESFEGQIWYVKASTSTNDLPNREEMTLILLLDGRFEDAVITEEMVKKVLDEVEAQRIKLPRKQMRTIVTISHEAYQRISKFELIGKLNPMGIIDLDNSTNTLTNAEMTNVLETYDISVKNVKGAQESKVLSQKQLQAIYECFNHHSWLGKKVNTIPKIGFPLVAALMSLNPHFLGNIDFVQEPIRHVWESIDQLRLSKNRRARNKYCTIVYASFKEGKVDTNDVDKGLLTKIGTFHGNPEVEIDPDFYILRNIRETVYEFLHESLLRAFFSAYGSQHLGFVIESCPLEVLLENSVSKRGTISSKERMFFLHIGGTYYEKTLINRVRNENVDIGHYRIWEQKEFKKIFKDLYAKEGGSTEKKN